ncbi:MAG: ABC transporter permease, partial [Chitinophagales bacterium]
TNSIFIWSQKTSMPYKGFQAGRWYSFNNKDIAILRERIKGIKYVVPRFWLPGDNVVSRKNQTGVFDMTGTNPDFIKVRKMDLTQGRFINNLDLEEKRKVVVIGLQVFKTLFEEGENPLGTYIKMKGNYFKVIGVFKSLRPAEDAIEEEQSLYLPITTAQQISNAGNRVGSISVTGAKGMLMKPLEPKIKKVLAAQHSIHPDDTRAIGSWNMEKEFQKFESTFLAIRLFTWFVGIMTMIAGIVGVSNIMLITVRERTREFGLRKALGATPWSIISLVMQESIVLTAFAGYIGLVSGVGLIELVNLFWIESGQDSQFFHNPSIDFNIAIAATIVLMLTGLVAGLIPSSQAANIKPIEALRTE